MIPVVAGTRLRNHLTGGAPGNPPAPVKVEAAGRRGRAEGPRGPAPRDPCRVERPALTGAGGFPTLSVLRWLRAPSPLERRSSGGHGPRNTVPCMSKEVSTKEPWVLALDLAGHRFEAPEDREPAEVTECDARRDRLARDPGNAELAFRPGQDFGGWFSAAALAEVPWAARGLIAWILPSHEPANPYSHAITRIGLRRSRPGEWGQRVVVWCSLARSHICNGG